MFDQIKTIIVIVGCQRSGTTLTGQILGGHDQAFLIDETDGLYKWFDSVGVNDLRGGKGLEELFIKADDKYKPKHARLVDLDGQKSLRPGIDHLVLKAPNLTYSYEKLAALNKDVRIVYPIRDPRAVVASMDRLSHIDMIGNQVKWMEKNDAICKDFADELKLFKNPETPVHIWRANVWKMKSGLYTRFENAGFDPFIFTYEKLIENKKTTCKSMVEHCGLPFDSKMLRHEHIYCGVGPGLTDRTRPVDAASIRKWETKLSSKEQTEIMGVAGNLALLFGYSQDANNGGDRPALTLSKNDFESPILMIGRGRAETKELAVSLQGLGVFLGNRLNPFLDSMEWLDLVYELSVKKMLADSKVRPFEDDVKGLFWDKANAILGYGNWKSGDLWGWNIPVTSLIVRELAPVFPKAKIIHLVQHPVTSCLQRNHMTARPDNAIGRVTLKRAYESMGLSQDRMKNDPKYIRNAVTWVYLAKLVHEFAQSSVAPDNYKLLRFEDLEVAPKKMTKSIREFVGSNVPRVKPSSIAKESVKSISYNQYAIDQVWSICESLALEFGYAPIVQDIDAKVAP